MRSVLILAFASAIGFLATAQAQQTTSIAPGSKVFVSPMAGGFDTYLKGALEKKKVPVKIVESKEAADFIISGAAESQTAGAAKKVIMLNWHSDESASIQVTQAATGAVIFAYTAVKNSSAHGKQSTAEACAKHLKQKIESGH